MGMGKEIVLITGSNGYIGSSLALRLSNRFRVIGLDREIPRNRIKDVDHRSLDISSLPEIRETLLSIRNDYGERIHSVIHLVAYYSFSGEESPKYDEITVSGSKNLVLSLNDFFEVEQFIFSSTMLVHNPASLDEEINERSPVTPSWPYPRSKVEAENAIDEVKGSIKSVHLRIAGVYDDFCHSIPLGHHIMRIYEEHLSSHFFPGNVNHGQSFLHLDDLIEAISRLIEKRLELPQSLTLLLGEDEALSYRTLQEMIGKLLHGRSWPTFRIPESLAKLGAYLQQKTPFMREPFIKPWMIEYADDQYDLDISEARKHLQWEPQNRLQLVLPKMIGALKADPERWYKEHKIVPPYYRNLKEDKLESIYRTMGIINIFLGIWIFSNPFVIGGLTNLEFWNDIIVGGLITFLAVLTMYPTLRWVRWLNALLASWLMFSPLVFWTDEPAFYSNNTILSAIVILASGFTSNASSSDESKIPPGWSYNPSSWRQRLPIMMLAFIGFLLARYLAAFQLGHIENAWDPFFGNGTERILTSNVSKAFPISDAGLGALSYLLDVIAASIGDKNRWKTMPWMVILFGLFIIPTGVTSITLVMLQPIGVGAWCTICLLASVIMLVMVPPSVDEVCASIQFLRRSIRSGKPFWKTFWLGSDEEENLESIPAEIEAKSFPFHLAVSAILGSWLLVSPWVFGITGIAANNIYITGSLVVTFAVIAFAEVARITRVLNVALGLWLMSSGFWPPDLSIWSRVHTFIMGLILLFLSIPRGAVLEHFGSMDFWARWTFLDFIKRYQHKSPRKRVD